MDSKIEYVGKVYLYSSGMSAELVERSMLVLNEHGVNPNDIVLIESPEGVPEGSIIITIWPHYLSVAKVKRVREGSIYAPQLFNIDI
ncbi:MAG TPA: hypothetical protein VLD84_01005 [Nitrososphaeraceae archaeon]|nr:hypothetical protein [Nitrososphaeraceae archaeon]